MMINENIFSGKEFKKLDIEYVKKIIWAMCWDQDSLDFNVDECINLLRELGALNENRIVFKKEEA